MRMAPIVTVRLIDVPMLFASWSLIMPVGGKTSSNATDTTAPISTRRTMRQMMLRFC